MVCCPEEVAFADGEEGSWIWTFSRVERVQVVVSGGLSASINDLEITLTLFQGFSPVLNSLHVSYYALQTSQIFGLISSLSVLKDLTLITNWPDIGDVLGFNAPPPAIRPSTSPTFTGILDLSPYRSEMVPPTHRLLDLPNGPHFRKLAVSWYYQEDLRWITELVVRGSDTLECLDVSRTCKVHSFWPRGAAITYLRF